MDKERQSREPQHDVDLQKQNALFLLKTKEIHQLTQKATDTSSRTPLTIESSSGKLLRQR